MWAVYAFGYTLIKMFNEDLIVLFTFAKNLFSQKNCIPQVMTEKSEHMSLELKNTDLHVILDAINVCPQNQIDIQ